MPVAAQALREALGEHVELMGSSGAQMVRIDGKVKRLIATNVEPHLPHAPPLARTCAATAREECKDDALIGGERRPACA